MLGFLKKYWVAILVLVASCAYFISMVAPDITWTNVDCDSMHYLSGAENIVVTPSQGAPLYNMFNALVVRLPVGNDFWRLCFFTAMFSGITSMLVYLMARRYTKRWWVALLAPLCFCASAVVLSQATILKQYSLITMICTLCVYLHFTGKDKWKYIVLMCGVGVHHLVILPLFLIFIHDLAKHKKEKSRLITKKMLLPILGLLFYIWIPLVNKEPYTMVTGTGFGDYISYFFRSRNLIGGLAIFTENGLQRIQDGIAILGYSFGACSLLIWYAIWHIKKHKDHEGFILAFLVIIPIIHYMINIDPSVYTYTMMAFAFGGVLVVKGTEWILGYRTVEPIESEGKTWYKEFYNRIRHRLSHLGNIFLTPKTRYAIPIVTGVCCVGFIISNTFFFDIGRNNDVGLEAKRYYESLENMPANASIWAGIISGANVAVQYHNDTYDSNVKIYPSWLYNYSLNLDAAEMAWAEDSLYVIDYGYNEYGDLTLNNRKVTAETYKTDWAYINSTAELVHPLTRGNVEFLTPTGYVIKGIVETGFANPITLIQGKVSYTRWINNIQSNLSAGYIFMWAFIGWQIPRINMIFFGRRCKKDKKIFGKVIRKETQLRIYQEILTIVVIVMLVEMFIHTGTPMFNMGIK
jgi:hypothetical protein